MTYKVNVNVCLIVLYIIYISLLNTDLLFLDTGKVKK